MHLAAISPDTSCTSSMTALKMKGNSGKLAHYSTAIAVDTRGLLASSPRTAATEGWSWPVDRSLARMLLSSFPEG